MEENFRAQHASNLEWGLTSGECSQGPDDLRPGRVYFGEAAIFHFPKPYFSSMLVWYGEATRGARARRAIFVSARSQSASRLRAGPRPFPAPPPRPPPCRATTPAHNA